MRREEGRRAGSLTGPIGMPTPPFMINRSSSSSRSSITFIPSVSSSSVKVVVASDSSPESCECVRVCTTSSPLDPGGWTAPEVTPSVSATGNKVLEGVEVTVRSLAAVGSTEVASLGGCGRVSDRGTDCGEATVVEVEGSLVLWEDCAGSGVRPFWAGDEPSPAVPTGGCFSLTAGVVEVG